MHGVGQWSEAVQDDLDAMMNVLEEVLRIIAAAESKDDRLTTWQIRVQLASSILDLILIDTEVCVYSQAPYTRLTLTSCSSILRCVRLQLSILGIIFTLTLDSFPLACACSCLS